MDAFVKNDLAIKAFNENVLLGTPPVSVAIRYHVPECFLRWQCIGACPRNAIDVEYDHLENREYMVTAGS